MCLSDDGNSSQKNKTNVISDTFFFISRFYDNLNLLFNHKLPYIMINKFQGFPKPVSAFEMENQMISSIKKTHIKMLSLKGISAESLA